MTIFERVISFEERTRWQMLKAALDSGTTAATIAKRLGWPRWRVNRAVMAPRPRLRIDDVAEWTFAIDGALLKFELLPKKSAP